MGVVIYITVGQVFHFDTALMRVVSLLALAGLAPVLYLLHRERRGSPIDKSFLVFFFLAALGFWLWPSGLGRVFQAFPVASLYFLLLVMAAGLPLIGREPFTTYFARRSTPEAVWGTDIFKRINRDMTWAWAGIFAACALTALIPDVFSAIRAPGWVLLFHLALPAALMLAAGVPLNRFYPGYYQRKQGLAPARPAGARTASSPGVEPPAGASKKEEVTMSDNGLVVAVNGSPHTGIGNTSQLLEMFREPLAAEGLNLEVIQLCEKRIEYCVGCALCLEKGNCWRHDDHAGVVERLLSADGIILASPVYFFHVTAQMKAFLDRSLAYGHKPRATWKPGLAVSVAAAFGETSVASYLSMILRIFGAFSVGELTALATRPGDFLGKEAVEARAQDLARDLARAIKEKRRYPASERDLFFYLLMGDLVRRERDLMVDDFEHWQNLGLYEGFESYVQQKFARPGFDPSLRKVWIE